MVKLPIVGSVMSLVRKSGSPPRMLQGRDRESRLRDGIDAAPLGIAYVGIDGRWIYYNERFREMIGYPSEHLARISFHDITHPDDAKMESVLVKRLLSNEVPNFRIEKRIMEKKGKYRELSVIVSLVRSERGDPDFFVYIIDDGVQAQAQQSSAGRAAANTRESERLLATAIDRIRDFGIIRTDDRGLITGWNSGAERIFGYKRDDVIGKTRRMLYRDPDNWEGKSTQQLGAASESGHVELEDWRVAKSGQHLWLKTSIMPIRPDGTTTRGYIEVVSAPSGPVEQQDVKADARIAEAKRNISMLRDEIEKRDRKEVSLRDAVDELRRVGAETMDELKIMTTALRNEIDRRKAAEEELRTLQSQIAELAAAPPPPPAPEPKQEEQEVVAPALPRKAWKKLDTSIAEVLVAQASAMLTGTLTVASRGRQTEVFFEFGKVFSVSTNDPARFLAQRLIELGHIDEEQRQRALEIQRETHLALGRILIILGAITEEKLLDAMRTKAEEEIEETFSWQDAKYAVIEGEIPTLQLVPLRIDVASFVVQRLSDREREDEMLVRTLDLPQLDQLDLPRFEPQLPAEEPEPPPVLPLEPLVSDADLPEFEVPAPPPPAPLTRAAAEVLFASSTGKGRKFHRDNCPTGKRVDEETRIIFTSVDDAVAAGYEPCRMCIK
jgi:PAS domain S-box-containing protein